MTTPGLWKNRNFQLVFSASSFTNLGDGVLAVAFPWFATLLTRDPLLIGLVAAARQLPWLLFALPAGVLADRFDRRNLILLADACRLLLALAAVALALSGAQGTGAVLLLTGLCFALGAAEVVRDNTAQSLLPNLVSKSQLEQANGLLWSTEQLAGQFIGPPLAGYLIGFAIFLPFGIEAAFLALAIALIAAIRLPKAAVLPRQAFGPALREGLSWLWGHQSLRRLALVLGAYNFIGSMFYAPSGALRPRGSRPRRLWLRPAHGDPGRWWPRRQPCRPVDSAPHRLDHGAALGPLRLYPLRRLHGGLGRISG